jgi:hypothetical protein
MNEAEAETIPSFENYLREMHEQGFSTFGLIAGVDTAGALHIAVHPMDTKEGETFDGIVEKQTIYAKKGVGPYEFEFIP